MATPVYLFTGFLDSGKTSLILDTLNDPSFMEENSRTLIICFEQGEVRYNDKYLAERKAFVEYMDSPEDLNVEKIRELDTIYHPNQVFIEYNGTLAITPFILSQMPNFWPLVQILTTVDATTFQMYINAMRSVIYEQLKYSDTIICNRCTPDTSASMLRGNIKAINKYEYLYCPNCLRPISLHEEASCLLCHQNMDDIVIEINDLKKERKKLTKKKNELHTYIDSEKEKNIRVGLEINKLQDNIDSDEEKLDSLTRQYINPLATEISLLSIKSGQLYEEKKSLNESLKFIEELTKLEMLLSEKRIEVEGIEEQIERQKYKDAKEDKLKQLSEKFSTILSYFEFPNLYEAYIDTKSYLPYVRGRKYSDLGSLGAVTLITMAYYLSIMICSKVQTGNHLGLLMIDTPRKNLGASSTSTEFRDEKIYESIINYFLQLGKECKNDFQLIVVNNGYPSDFPLDYIVKEFSSDVHDGLIDDYGRV